MQLTSSLPRKTLVGAALGLIAAALVLLLTRLLMPSIFERFEAETLDSRYYAKIRQQTALRKGGVVEDIVIVDIDQRSLDKLGLYSQWPRSYHAKVIEYLREQNAAVIGFDILFMEREEGFADSMLVANTAAAGNVVHALAFSAADPQTFLPPMQAAPSQFEVQRYAFKFPTRRPFEFPSEERFSGKFFALYNRKIGRAHV